MTGKSMADGTPWKHILRFALPVLAGSLLQQLYNTVDSIVVGNFSGEDALSAVGTTGSFTFLFLALATGFSAGNGVVVAQHYGAGNEKQVRANASTGILLMLGMGILSTVIGILVSRPAYTYLVDVPKDFLELTLQYFRIYAVGLIFQFGYNIFSSILRAIGDSAATLYFLLIASVLNVILDLVFVAGLNWGVVGAAIATDIAQAGSFVAAYIYMTRKYPIFRFKPKELKWNSALAKRTLVTGFPIALQLIIVSFGLTFIQRAVNGFGQAMTASFTVGQRIEMYMNLPCNAFQTTLATYTGQNIGAGKMDRVRKGAHQAILMSFLLTLYISVIAWTFSENIITLFGLSDKAAIYCNDHLKTIALINIILSLYIPLFGVFQGANHGAAATVVATGALTTRVLVTYIFRYGDLFGHTIIWWNGLFGFGMGFLITWSYYLSRRWQNKAAIDNQTHNFREEINMKKTIVVVGAGKGLGNGVAEKFAGNNFRVILMARSEEHLKEYASDFAAKGIEVYTQAADVADFDAFAETFGKVVETYGIPDVLFYNVGVTIADENAEITAKTLAERYAVDVAGAYNCVKLLDTEEFAEKNGVILITGGGLALQPYAGYLPLSMDKAALRAMVQALSPVLREKGIYIGTVQVTGVIGSNDHFAPKTIAEQFWNLYTNRDTNEIVY